VPSPSRGEGKKGLVPNLIRLLIPHESGQGFEVWVAAGGQDDAQIHVQVAVAIEALAFETERLAGVDAGREVEFDGTVERRYPHLGAEYRLVEGQRRVGAQIGAIAAELLGFFEAHGDQRVAGFAEAGRALALEADLLTLLDLFGQL